MSYDDEDAKSRRNLVVASTLVLAGVWLRLPPGSLIERLTGVKPDQPDQLAARVWIGVLAVLLYLILRFKFSDLHAKASEELRTEFDASRLRILKRYAQSQLNRFARGIEAPIFGDSLLSKFKHRQLIADMLKHKPNTVVQRKLEGGEVRYDPNRRIGDIKFNTAERFTGGGGSYGETDMVPFEVSRWAHVRFNLQSSLWIGMYSRATTAILLPWGLCFLAMMVSIWRLLQAWWA